LTFLQKTYKNAAAVRRVKSEGGIRWKNRIEIISEKVVGKVVEYTQKMNGGKSL
jgi:hypothetical protein